jgi:NADH pyrophosphatase NudC (nudix superfamily)
MVMTFGKQCRFCPNCGQGMYDTALSMNHVQSMMCSDECRKEWELKYARMVLGKDWNPVDVAV